MNDAHTQMSAMSAAMRMLLAGHRLAKPDDLLIAASDGVTEPLIDMMMANALQGRATFLAVFHVEEDAALLDRVMVVDGSTTRGEVNIGCGKFVQRADGSFAILSANRDEPYLYRLSRGGRRLERRTLSDDRDRAGMELRGLQALIAKAATPACQAEARTASLTHC